MGGQFESDKCAQLHRNLHIRGDLNKSHPFFVLLQFG